MSAPVRLEAFAFDDLRFEKLAKLAGLADGDHALIKLARVWAYCTRHSTDVIGSEDFDLVARVSGFARCCCEVGLATETKRGIRLRGGRERLLWLEKKRKAAAKGGAATKAKWGADGRPDGLADGPRMLGPTATALVTATAIAPATALKERGDVSPPVAETSPPVEAAPKRRAGKRAPASSAEDAVVARVLGRLSERSGREYRPSTEQHARRILRLLREGYTEDDLRLVVWDRANRWAGDPKMDEYLRPSTLFGPEKFPDYLAEAKAADAIEATEEAQRAARLKAAAPGFDLAGLLKA